MKQQYYHFESPTKWPQFILDTLAEIQDMKKQNGNTITKEIYDKTLGVAVWMGMIENNQKINNANDTKHK